VSRAPTMLGAALFALTACAAPPPPAQNTDAAADAHAQTDASADASQAVDLAMLADQVMNSAIDADPMNTARCPAAMVVVVTSASRLVRGYGAAQRASAQRPDEHSLFQIGSITKMFTGIAVARRIADRALAADASAGALLAPDLAAAPIAWPTMEALLTHHSGMPVFPANLADRNGDGARDPDIDARSPATGYNRAHLRAALDAWTPPPSPTYLYSNLGVGVAGLALQDHLGVSDYHSALRRLVTDTLEMRETWGEAAAIDSDAQARVVQAYAAAGAGRAPGVLGQMGVLASAGEIVTSGADMATLLEALTGLRSTPLDAAITLATTPRASGPDGRSMGLAIEIEDRARGPVFRKGGNTSSYTAYVLWSRAPSVGVAVLTGCGGFMRVVSLAEALYEGAAR
jgi:D-alanyl-D-alanine-carboxypeptidase/D-alanyl-D-alanine-endopeptidase